MNHSPPPNVSELLADNTPPSPSVIHWGHQCWSPAWIHSLLQHCNIFLIKHLFACLLCPSINYLTDESKNLWQWKLTFLVDLPYDSITIWTVVGFGGSLGCRSGVRAITHLLWSYSKTQWLHPLWHSSSLSATSHCWPLAISGLFTSHPTGSYNTLKRDGSIVSKILCNTQVTGPRNKEMYLPFFQRTPGLKI